MEKMALTHLRALEAESIHILREVVAEFAKPVMLYSIGKDSSVMVRLAQKAFYPGKLPFPLLHVDTTYKFREMIEFRDRFTKEIGAELIVHTNRKRDRRRRESLSAGYRKMLRTAEDARPARRARGTAATTRPSAARGATRRNRGPRSVSTPSAIPSASGIPRISGPSCGTSTTRRVDKGESIRVFPLSNWTELDVWQYIHLENIPIVPLYFAKERTWWCAAER